MMGIGDICVKFFYRSLISGFKQFLIDFRIIKAADRNTVLLKKYVCAYPIRSRIQTFMGWRF